MRDPARTTGILLATSLLALTMLTGCGTPATGNTQATGTDTGTNTQSLPLPDTPGGGSDTTRDADATAPGNPDAGKEKAIDRTITDHALGHTITIEAIIPGWDGLDGLETQYPALDGATVWLVKAKVTAGDKYYASVGPLDLHLVQGDQEATATSISAWTDRMKAAGHEPLEDAGHGQTKEGWLLYAMRNTTGTAGATIRYSRLAYHTDSGIRIDPWTGDIPLD